MTDRLLRQEIIDELDFEPSVDAANIGVAAKGGVVTLSGHVSSYTQKLAAVRATRRVRGVHAIADELEVRYAFDKKTADDEIAKRALDILRWSDGAPAEAVSVTVRDGWVTLTGQADWQFQKAAAESAVRRLSGVSGVINNIAVKPRVQPMDVKQKIQDALKRSAEIEASGIRVSVADGKVTLEGKVHDLNEKYAVENAAWAAAGVRTVEDRLIVV